LEDFTSALIREIIKKSGQHLEKSELQKSARQNISVKIDQRSIYDIISTFHPKNLLIHGHTLCILLAATMDLSMIFSGQR
jgi:hypothetical protein